MKKLETFRVFQGLKGIQVNLEPKRMEDFE